MKFIASAAVNIGRKSLNTGRSGADKFGCVCERKENLGDMVRRIRQENGLSTTDVERASGRTISASYVTRIENEPDINPSLRKLKALAKGLCVTENVLLDLPIPLCGDYEIPAEIADILFNLNGLKSTDRREVLIVLRVINGDIKRRLA